MRILIVSPYLPHAEIGHGGGISTYHFTRQLARRHEVELLCWQRHGEAARVADLAAAGVVIHGLGFRSPRDPAWRRPALFADRALCAVRALFAARPPTVLKYERSAMHVALRSIASRFDPDVIQFEYTLLAGYAAAMRRARGSAQRPLLLLNSHEAALLPRRRRRQRARGALPRLRSTLELRLWRRQELAALRAADLLQCVTEQDRQIYLELGARPEQLWLQPLGVDIEGLPLAAPPTADAPRLLFVGSFDHEPNREAAQRLVFEIFPRLAASLPSLRLDIVGARPPQQLSEQRDSRIRVHGFVPDLGHIFDGASLFAAPLFSGGGIKIKVLEAMARGAAVLTTPIGAEGIAARAGQELLVAADIDSFVAQAVQFLRDPKGARELGLRARTRMQAAYGWPTLVEAFERRLAQTGVGSSQHRS